MDLRVAPGEVVALLGPNGAGKSTLMRVLSGVLEPDTGDVSRDGRIGWLPEDFALPAPETVRGAVNRFAKLRDADPADAIESTGIRDLMRRPVGRLSRGQRQRVGLAIALIGAPETLLLDEPGTALDPVQLEALRRQIVRSAAAGAAVLISTHVLSDALEVCDRTAIIFAGSVRAQTCGGDLATLKSAYARVVGET